MRGRPLGGTRRGPAGFIRTMFANLRGTRVGPCSLPFPDLRLCTLVFAGSARHVRDKCETAAYKSGSWATHSALDSVALLLVLRWDIAGAARAVSRSSHNRSGTASRTGTVLRAPGIEHVLQGLAVRPRLTSTTASPSSHAESLSLRACYYC